MTFFRQYTKWIPLGEFTFSSAQSIVMARGDKKTGELFFKTKQINRHLLGYNHPIGKLPLDVSEQWNKLIESLNS